MKVPYDEEIANRIGSESCAGARKGVGEALTGGVRAGILSRENANYRVPTCSTHTEGKMDCFDIARSSLTLRGLRPRARTHVSRAGTGRSCDWPS